VLDLTRILAGPVAGRTLAAYGADVMLVNSPQLPNIEAIADTSRGKLSVHVDLQTAAGRDTLRALVRDADVFLQGYRPGALAALGFGPDELAAAEPAAGVRVAVGLWRRRPLGRAARLRLAGADGHRLQPWPKRRPSARTGRRPCRCRCWTTAPASCWPSAPRRRCCAAAHEGGGWRVRVSLAGVGHWLQGLGRLPAATWPAPDFSRVMELGASGFGTLAAVRHAARLSHSAVGYARPAMPPGSHPAAWPAR
jgi:crotonobetainyl-CoA:carnitine CoA-transferase CaiB-like acyl-CoA transferase